MMTCGHVVIKRINVVIKVVKKKQNVVIKNRKARNKGVSTILLIRLYFILLNNIGRRVVILLSFNYL